MHDMFVLSRSRLSTLIPAATTCQIRLLRFSLFTLVDSLHDSARLTAKLTSVVLWVEVGSN